MAESYFSLSAKDQRDLLVTLESATGRPDFLLEKDIWVVWALEQLYESPIGSHLTFKGGTSLSKAYRAIDRFSEDIDLTYDIRAIIPDLTNSGEYPTTNSAAKAWSRRIRDELPRLLETDVLPLFHSTPASERGVRIEPCPKDPSTLYLRYDEVTRFRDYIDPRLKLEFGARATGEPAETKRVLCDAASGGIDIEFPEATVRVLHISRTFWEKLTATHVFCLQDKNRGERFARHWYDLVQIWNSADAPTNPRELLAPDIAEAVATHKRWFFREKCRDGVEINYGNCLNGALSILPTGTQYEALRQDYEQMLNAGLLPDAAENFDALMHRCAKIENKINRRFADLA